MVIIFQKNKKEQKKLILIFIILVLIIATIIWLGFFRKEIRVFYEEPLIFPRKEIRINFEVLRRPILEKLELFYEIEPLKQEIGRKNPFVLFEEKVEEEEIAPENNI